MHKTFFRILLWCALGAAVFSVGAQTAGEYLSARQALEKRGEVAFVCRVNAYADLIPLTAIVSIDKVVDGTTVYAYANKQEFERFLALGIPFTVLPRPAIFPAAKPARSVRSLRNAWTSYPAYDVYVSAMQQFASGFPALCAVEEFGASVAGRKLLAARVTSSVASVKPRVFLQAAIHGDELCGWILMMRLIEHLCANYGSDARVTRLVDSVEIWINPLANPDGTYFGGDTTIAGARRNNGHDVDLNRNFPAIGTVTRATPEPETQATIDFCDKYPFVMAADIHSGSELCCYVWGCRPQQHADEAWWRLVGREFADTAQKNGPAGYFDELGGLINGYAWYPVTGEHMDYLACRQQCRSLTMEIVTGKLLPDTLLDDYWRYLRPSFLNYLEQSRYGIRGIVSDSLTGTPLAAKVFVKNHDVDSSHVYSHLPHGDYYRPIAAGSYTLEFSCEGYRTRVVSGITVENKKAAALDIQLVKSSDDVVLSHTKMTARGVRITPMSKGVRITVDSFSQNARFVATVYSISGNRIKELSGGGRTLFWDGSNTTGKSAGKGCYVLRVSAGKESVVGTFVY